MEQLGQWKRTHPQKHRKLKHKMAANRGICRFMLFLVIVAAAAGADYDNVEIPKKLEVDTLTSKTYTDFLNKLRQGLAKTQSKGVPVLTVYTPKNPPTFDLILTAGTSTTTARFRKDNLYLIGFQMQNKKWYEFGYKQNKPPQLIKGSEFLGFNETYVDLQRAAGSEVTAMEINKEKLKEAVYSLARSEDRKERATAVIVVVQMISEAARFLDVSDHFASNLAKDATLPAWMKTDLENEWGPFSYMVLKSDADRCYEFPAPTINGKVIKTVYELRGYFGVLYRDPDTLKPPCSKSLYDEMTSVFEFEARRLGPEVVAQA